MVANGGGQTSLVSVREEERSELRWASGKTLLLRRLVSSHLISSSLLSLHTLPRSSSVHLIRQHLTGCLPALEAPSPSTTEHDSALNDPKEQLARRPQFQSTPLSLLLHLSYWELSSAPKLPSVLSLHSEFPPLAPPISP